MTRQTLSKKEEALQHINAALEEQSITKSYHFIDNTEIFVQDLSNMLADGLHPSVQGYHRWLPRIKEQIADLEA